MSEGNTKDNQATEALHVQNGHVLIFEDFEDSGQMWAGEGERSVSQTVKFWRPFIQPPKVQLSVSLMDARTEVMIRYSLSTQNVTAEQFDAVFSTWGDSKFARIGVDWMAVGMSIRDEYWVDY